MEEVFTRCEKHGEVTILHTKLDILIDDFRESKEDQKALNRDIREHNVAEDKVQARIESTLQWHTIIGTFMVGVITGLVYLHSGVK